MFDQRDANHCKKGMYRQEVTSRKVLGSNPGYNKKKNYREISVKVYLYDHLAMEFVHYSCEIHCKAIFFGLDQLVSHN